MRYVIALVVAGLLIGGGFLFVYQTDRSFEGYFRDALRKQKQAGTLPPELQNVDIDTAEMRDLGHDWNLHLPAAWMRRIQISLMLHKWRYILASVTVLGCLAVAFLTGRRRVAN